MKPENCHVGQQVTQQPVFGDIGTVISLHFALDEDNGLVPSAMVDWGDGEPVEEDVDTLTEVKKVDHSRLPHVSPGMP